jgi:hypothetical protein
MVVLEEQEEVMVQPKQQQMVVMVGAVVAEVEEGLEKQDLIRVLVAPVVMVMLQFFVTNN